MTAPQRGRIIISLAAGPLGAPRVLCTKRGMQTSAGRRTGLHRIVAVPHAGMSTPLQPQRGGEQGINTGAHRKRRSQSWLVPPPLTSPRNATSSAGRCQALLRVEEKALCRAPPPQNRFPRAPLPQIRDEGVALRPRGQVKRHHRPWERQEEKAKEKGALMRSRKGSAAKVSAMPLRLVLLSLHGRPRGVKQSLAVRHPSPRSTAQRGAARRWQEARRRRAGAVCRVRTRPPDVPDSPRVRLGERLRRDAESASQPVNPHSQTTPAKRAERGTAEHCTAMGTSIWKRNDATAGPTRGWASLRGKAGRAGRTLRPSLSTPPVIAAFSTSLYCDAARGRWGALLVW